MRSIVATTAIVLFAACAAAAQQSGTQRVAYSGPAQVQVVADHAQTVTLQFTIIPGFHINSHQPRDPELIATRLALVETPGVTMTGVDFPPGEEYAFDFDPGTKLSVYSGVFTVATHVRATTGEHPLDGLLHYQACDNRTCYPPKDVPVKITLVAK